LDNSRFSQGFDSVGHSVFRQWHDVEFGCLANMSEILTVHIHCLCFKYWLIRREQMKEAAQEQWLVDVLSARTVGWSVCPEDGDRKDVQNVSSILLHCMTTGSVLDVNI
jgi:hypothetical protein